MDCGELLAGISWKPSPEGNSLGLRSEFGIHHSSLRCRRGSGTTSPRGEMPPLRKEQQRLADHSQA
eukprot:12654416-Alexandrium_andersonii.AAC.1